MNEAQSHNLTVQRTARYFTYGELSPQTEHIWFALHGYGMLAKSLINRFDGLDTQKHFIVAPEGLSRFYWGGFSKKPVASWMTSEDRLSEIKDYIAYLDQLYEYILKQGSISNATINAMGFSQGTATCARWLSAGNSKVQNMIFWAGPLPEDVEWEQTIAVFNKAKVLFVNGTEDPFITEEHKLGHFQKLNDLGLNYESFSFEGKHEVDRETLKKVADWCDASL